MDCIEQAKRLYVISVESAKRHSLLTYEESLTILGYGAGVHEDALTDGLKLLLIACLTSGLPPLTSILVSKDERSSSVTIDPIDQWSSDIQGIFNYTTWPEVEEIDWNYVWDNRKQLSDIHGTRGYLNNIVHQQNTKITRIRPVVKYIEDDDSDDDPFGGGIAMRA